MFRERGMAGRGGVGVGAVLHLFVTVSCKAAPERGRRLATEPACTHTYPRRGDCLLLRGSITGGAQPA
eukprot:364723-Chlamydomonas_euryale.AAC.13